MNNSDSSSMSPGFAAAAAAAAAARGMSNRDSLRSLITGQLARPTIGSFSRYSEMPPLERLGGRLPILSTSMSAPQLRPSTFASVASPPTAASARAFTAPSHTSLRRSARIARTFPSEMPASSDPPVIQTRASKKRGRVAPAPRSSKRCKTLKKPPPEASPANEDLDKKPSAEADTCTICMCEPEPSEVSSIDGCDHMYCFACIGKWSERENSCPLCKARFTKITRINPQRRKKGSTASVRNTKRVKKRDQRLDVVPGAALEGLLASIANGGPLSRYIYATQMGGPGRHRVRTARMTVNAQTGATSFHTGPVLAHPFFSFDEDEEDGIMGMFPGFMSAILRTHHEQNDEGYANISGVAGLGVPPARSHASNADDFTAGRAPENPLEIDDSEDEIEVVQVARR